MVVACHCQGLRGAGRSTTGSSVPITIANTGISLRKAWSHPIRSIRDWRPWRTSASPPMSP